MGDSQTSIVSYNYGIGIGIGIEDACLKPVLQLSHNHAVVIKYLIWYSGQPLTDAAVGLNFDT